MTKRRNTFYPDKFLKSGTSIGANIEEAKQGQSKLDFVSKLSIANKEAFETNYWLRLLRDSELIGEKSADSMLKDCEDLKSSWSLQSKRQN